MVFFVGGGVAVKAEEGRNPDVGSSDIFVGFGPPGF